MPNGIKYTTGAVETGCLKKGNMLIANNTADYGTSFFSGINPPSGGYSLYLNKASGGPSIYCPANNTQLISITNQIAGANYTTAAQCLDYFATQTDKLCVNFNYEGIVTSGLVLNLDAGFDPSYPTTGSTWYDLSGNSYNGTLTNGPTFNSANSGSIVFDGTNDYVNVPPVILNTPWSLCTTIKASNSGFPALYSQNGLCIWVGVTPNLAIGVHTNFATRVDTPAGSFNLNQVYFVGISSSPSSLTVYINNTKYSLTPGANPTAASTASIASYSDKTKDFLGGSIYNFLMYNRALTDTEILQNYNAQKGRFGL